MPLMPRDLPQLRQTIVGTVAAIDRVWEELDFRIDICRVTKGGHSVLTSVLIFPVVGLGALLTVTHLFFPSLHGHLT